VWWCGRDLWCGGEMLIHREIEGIVRWIQDPVGITPCGFKSRPRHHLKAHAEKSKASSS